MQKSLTERATPRSPSLGARDATRRRHPPSRWPLVTAFTVINLANILASLLSLGAIDFGIVGDSIVMTKAILRLREAKPDEPYTEEVFSVIGTSGN